MEKEMLFVMIIFTIVAVSVYVTAEPSAITHLNEEGDSTRTAPSSKSNEAQAGNLTEVTANSTTITKTWQGYYGNITGEIVLDNADNVSMYSWTAMSPTGTILAANSTISDFSSVKCWQWENGTEFNLTDFENNLNCTGEIDCVNATFNSTVHEAITVGTQTFTNECQAVKSYVNDGASTDFDEILLYETTNNVVIYAAQINQDTNGFDNTPTDFQMLVGEDGHGPSASTYTTYYFYLEMT